MTLIWDIERAGLVRFGDAIRYLESMGDRLFMKIWILPPRFFGGSSMIVISLAVFFRRC